MASECETSQLGCVRRPNRCPSGTVAKVAGDGNGGTETGPRSDPKQIRVSQRIAEGALIRRSAERKCGTDKYTEHHSRQANLFDNSLMDLRETGIDFDSGESVEQLKNYPVWRNVNGADREPGHHRCQQNKDANHDLTSRQTRDREGFGSVGRSHDRSALRSGPSVPKGAGDDRYEFDETRAPARRDVVVEFDHVSVDHGAERTPTRSLSDSCGILRATKRVG